MGEEYSETSLSSDNKVEELANKLKNELDLMIMKHCTPNPLLIHKDGILL